MNRDLEALLKAYDAFMQARGKKAEQLRALYESRLEECLTPHPGLTRELLHRTVQLAYRRWVRAQSKPSTIPPTA